MPYSGKVVFKMPEFGRTENSGELGFCHFFRKKEDELKTNYEKVFRYLILLCNVDSIHTIIYFLTRLR